MESIENYKKEKTRKEKSKHMSLRGKVREWGRLGSKEWGWIWSKDFICMHQVKQMFWKSHNVVFKICHAQISSFLNVSFDYMIFLGESFWVHALDHLWTNIASIWLICCSHQFPMFQAHLQYGFPTHCGYNIV